MVTRDLPRTLEDVESRRSVAANRMVFAVRGLYGLSAQSVGLPLNRDETIESGQICVTLDPEADLGQNVGAIDFEDCSLRVRYGVQMVFPGLHDLVTRGGFDLSLLRPPRATATDTCKVSPDYSGWRALGCLDFLPGSLWSGAKGG